MGAAQTFRKLISNSMMFSYINILGAPNPILIYAMELVSYLGFGFIFGNATSLILYLSGDKAKLTSSLMISCEMLCSGIAIYILSFFFDGSFLPISCYGLFVSISMIVLINGCKNINI